MKEKYWHFQKCYMKSPNLCRLCNNIFILFLNVFCILYSIKYLYFSLNNVHVIIILIPIFYTSSSLRILSLSVVNGVLLDFTPTLVFVAIWCLSNGKIQKHLLWDFNKSKKKYTLLKN